MSGGGAWGDAELMSGCMVQGSGAGLVESKLPDGVERVHFELVVLVMRPVCTGKRTRSAYTPHCHAASPGFKLVLSGRISCTWVDEDFEVIVMKYDRVFLGEGGHNLRLF